MCLIPSEYISGELQGQTVEVAILYSLTGVPLKSAFGPMKESDSSREGVLNCPRGLGEGISIR